MVHICMKYSLFFVFIFMICSVAASNYSIEFNQFDNRIAVVEINNEEKTTYILENDMESTNSGYIFLEKVVAKENFDNFEISLTLEKNILPNLQRTFPSKNTVEILGDNVKLSWNYYNVSEGEEFALFVVLQDNNLKSELILYIIISIIAFVLIFFIVRYASKKREDINKYLLEEEQKIIKFLGNCDRHESWQRKIQEVLNLSKTKTSRLIRNLESRSLIEKIPFGNTNKIRLK